MKKLFQSPTMEVGRDRTSSTKLIMLAGLCIFLLGITAGWLLNSNKQQQTVYVNTSELFDGFTMAKGLQARLTASEQARQTALEDLSIKAQQMAFRAEKQPKNQFLGDSLQVLAVELTQKEEQFGRENQAQADEYNEQIWAQLNQYLLDYCKSQDLAYVLGTNGQGTLMVADPQLDHTDDVIQFVNNKFTGKL